MEWILYQFPELYPSQFFIPIQNERIFGQSENMCEWSPTIPHPFQQHIAAGFYKFRVVLKKKKQPCLCLPIKLFPRVTTDSFMATTADYYPQPILDYKIQLHLPFSLNIISSV